MPFFTVPLLAVPWLLWALPLAAAPIAWHLFLRPRRRAVAFPSLLFFMKVEPRLEGRRKLREYLSLALRCLLIALLILALARPHLAAVGGSGSTALAVVLDTSASMAALGADGRPLGRVANEATAALLGQLGAGSRVVIVPTAPDPAVALPPRPSNDLAALGAALDRLTPTEAMGDAAGALVRAAAALADDDAGDREIRIFSDLQAGEWDLPARLPALPPGVRVTVHQLTQRTANGGIDVLGVQPPPGRPVAGRPARCLVTLGNRTRTAAPAALRITRPDGSEDLRESTVPAGGETVLPLLLTAPQPGPTWAMLRLDSGSGTALRAGVALWAQERLPVLLVGDLNRFGPLTLALAPDGNGGLSGLMPQEIATTALGAELPRRNPGLVVAAWQDLVALPEAAVRPWLAAGGTLLVMPAADGTPAPAQVPTWVGCHPLAEVRSTPPAATVLPDSGAACWEHVRDAAGGVGVKLRVQRAWTLAGDADLRIALALADGRPLLAERAVGKGLIVACGLAFHPAWSDLPLKGWSLALVQGLALRNAPADRTFALVAGQGLPPALGDRTPTRLRALAGGPLDWRGTRAEAPVLVHAGVYQLEREGAPTTLVAVRAAPDEGLPRYVTAEHSATLAGLAARSVPLHDASEAVADWKAQRRGLDLLPWLLLAALACWLVEGWLASGGGRSVR
jgi:hypothetical protein